MTVDINTRSNKTVAWATIELPDSGDGIQYLWVGREGHYWGTIEDVRSLRKLKKMIDKCLKSRGLKP